MKIVFCAAATALLLSSFDHIPAMRNVSRPVIADTARINHVLDGSVAEWPAGNFQPDEDTTIFLALDNDGQSLYAAMTIPDFSMQSKLMKNGMEFYIDLKGKRKESRGIEFPIKGEVNNFLAGSNPVVPMPGANGNEEPKKELPKEFDKKTQRSIMSLGMTACKVFGMETTKADEQGIRMPGGVNIQFKWDADDKMHIEYLVPLKFLGDNVALDKKEITIGWKVNGFDRSQIADRPGMNTPGSPEPFQQQHNSPGSAGFNNGRRPERPRSMAELMREQHFWARYIVNIPAAKAF